MNRIGYITARYPAVSNTFVQEEVKQLRQIGVDIRTYSVRRVDDEHVLSEADKESFRTTTPLLPVSLSRLARAHIRALTKSPGAYFSTLKFALSRGKSLRGLLYQVFYFAEALLLWEDCRREGIRHIHAHMANVASDVARLAAAFGSACNEQWSWSFTMHGPTEFFDVRHFGLADKVADATFVVCISDFCRSQLMAIAGSGYEDKLHVVHCGIDTERFTRLETGEQSALRMLSVGRLVPEKGQALLVRALGVLVSNGLDASLVLVGDGPARPTVEHLIHELGLTERVQLTGSVGQDDIGEYYARADVFCLPSSAEGVPIVLMEAMAQHIPVVSTRVAGIPELIEDGEEGILISPGRVDQLVDALQRLADDRSLRVMLAKRGAEKVQEVFNASTCAEQLRDVFRRYL